MCIVKRNSKKLHCGQFGLSLSPMKPPTMLCSTVFLLIFYLQDVSAQSTYTDTSSGLSTCEASKADLQDTLDTVLNDNDASREEMKKMAAESKRKENNLNLELQVAKNEIEQLKQNSNPDPELSTTQPGTPGYQVKIAFSALLQKGFGRVDRDTIIIYETTKENAGNGYDNKTGIFECPYAGLYTFFWTNRCMAANLKTRLVHNENSVAASSESTGSYHCHSGNSALLNLALRDKVKIVIKGNSGIQGAYTASLFIGHPVADPYGAFYAVLMGNLGQASVDQTITFDTIKINNGNFYSSPTGTYTAPRNGVYRVFYSATSRNKNVGCHIALYLNGQAVAGAKANYSGIYSMAEKSVLLDLKQDDRVSVKLIAGGQIGNDATGPGVSTTSFFAHLVSAAGTTSQVIAFCGVRTTSIQELGYMTYDKVLANAGNAFNPYSGGFEAPLKGTYTFYLSIDAEQGGTIGGTTVQIRKNEGTVAAASQRQGSVSTSTSIILELERGDTIFSYLSNGKAYSDPNGKNTFITLYGYLIFLSD